MISEIIHVLKHIAKDRLFKVFLTQLCLTSFVLTVFWPHLAVHSACVGLCTNLVWIWADV